MKQNDNFANHDITRHDAWAGRSSTHLQRLQRLAPMLLVAWLLAAPAKAADADLSVSITSAPNPASTGSNLVYTITVTNAGPDAATGVTVTNKLSSGQILAGGGGACPSPGPVAWWKAEGNETDSAGTNTGTLVNGATFAAGQVGQAFSLDGSDDFVSILDSPSLRPANLTIEGWFNFSTASGIKVMMAKPLGTGVSDSYAMLMVNGDLYGLVSDNSGLGPFVIHSLNPTLGQWYHLAYVFDDTNDTQKIYVNGAEVQSTGVTTSIDYDANPVRLGNDIESGSDNFFFFGLMDEVSLYDRVLSASELLAIYNAGSAGKCSSSTLIVLGSLASQASVTTNLTVVTTNCSGMITNIVCVTTSDTDLNPDNNMATNTVTVADLIVPTITCVADKTVECASTWDFDEPSATDNCGTPTVSILSTTTNAVGFCGDTFEATRTWKATDAAGNMAQCSQKVTVEDTTDPTITCVGDKTVECGSVWDFDAPMASDTCGSVTVSIVSTVTNAVGFCGQTFEVTRTWEAIDDCGNTAQCSQKVTVVDTTDPMITCVADKAADCDTPWNFDAPSASDTCGGVTVSIVSTVTNTLGGGSFEAIRTWEATDDCTNTAQCSQKVTVTDGSPPTITCVVDKTVECGSGWNFDAPTASDTCSSVTVSILSTVTNAVGFCGQTFEATRTWEATDAAGNMAQCSQKVTVEDTTDPTITCVDDKTVECGSVWSFDAPSVSDNCGSATVSIVSTVTNAVGFCGLTFEVTRTWEATDGCGNVSLMCSQKVTVADTTDPTITCVADKTVECESVWSFDAPMASDTCGSATVSIVSTVTNAVGFCGQTFEVTRTWEAIDDCGNTAQCSQKVTVVDTTDPMITCVADKAADCDTPWNFDAPSASDTCGGVTVSIVSTVTNTLGGGSFEAIRTWEATDDCTNTAQCSQKVTVTDGSPPTITCVVDKTVECGSGWNFDAPTASDTCSSVTVSILSTVTNAVGFCGQTFEATRTWEATDAAGNMAQCSQKVTVEDTTDPTITCVDDKTVECGSVWSFDAPSVSDNCGSATVSIVSTVTNAVGFCGLTFEVTRTWEATDECGNVSLTCSQKVTVVDTTDPTITCGADKTEDCATPWDFDAPSASDTCGGVMVSIVSTVTNTPGGGSFEVIRTWEATDDCGNTAQCSQKVTVTDGTPPTIACVADKTAECGSAWDFDAPTAGDTCASVTVNIVSTVTNAVGFCGQTFEATRTWKATDLAGNMAQCSQKVTLTDTTNPNITCPATATVGCNTSIDPGVTGSATATDNCDPTPTITYTDDVAPTPCPTVITRTWKATDACGNMITCDQTINVVILSCACVNSNTISWWRAENDATDSFDGNHGTLTNGTTFTVGNVGQAFSLDGVNDFVYIPDSASLRPASLTIEGWFNFSSASGIRVLVAKPLGTAALDSYAMILIGGDLYGLISDNGGLGPFVIYSLNPTLGQWYHLAYVFDDATDTQTLYVNGVAVQSTSVTQSIDYDNNPVRLGNDIENGADSFFFSGLMDEITIYDRALSGTEIDAIYDAGTTGKDNIAPSVTSCPADETIQCPATPAFGTPVFADNCDTTLTVTFDDTSLLATCPAVSVTQRTWTATDDCGNAVTCSQTITVQDTTAPTVTSCPTDETIQCPATPVFGTPVFDDTCDTNLTVTFAETTLPAICPAVVVVQRTWTATDDCGNSNTCSQTITVESSIPPTLTCVADKNAECGAWTFDEPTVNNACGTVTVSIVTTVTNIIGSCASTFTATRTWKATDSCNNESAPCSQTVTVADTTPPEITCPVEAIVDCSSSTDPSVTGEPTVTDCDPSPTVTFSDSVAGGPCPDSLLITRTWTATDCAGNVSTCLQTITVTAQTLLTCPCVAPDIISWWKAETNANDSADGNHGTLEGDTAFVAGKVGQAFILDGFSDYVSILDSTSLQPTNLTIEGWFNFSSPSPLQVLVSKTLGSGVLDSYQIVFHNGVLRASIADSSGFSPDVTYPFTPVLGQWYHFAFTFDDAAEAQALYVNSALVASNSTTKSIEYDAHPVLLGGDIESESPSFFFGGLIDEVTFYSRALSATEILAIYGAGATGKDHTPPAVTSCPADETIQCPATPSFGTPVFEDLCDTNLTVTFEDTPLPATCPAVSVVQRTWTATDDCGNSNSCSQTITVEDTTAPTVTSCPTDETIQCPATPVFGTPVFDDTCDTNLTVTFEDTTLPGICPAVAVFQRTWTATDDCGNSNTCTQSITIESTIPPTLTCVPDKIAECGAWTFDEPTIDSACGVVTLSIVSTVTNATGPCDGMFEVTRTWKATDSCTNESAPCSQTVTVMDTIAPEFTICPTNYNLGCNPTTIPGCDLGTVAATDNCGIPTITCAANDVVNGCAHTRTLTYTATDSCGNPAICVQVISWTEDTSPPTITCPDAVTVSDESAIPAPATDYASFVTAGGSANDDCGEPVTVTHVGDIMTSSNGPTDFVITRTYQATDACTNSATCEQTITVAGGQVTGQVQLQGFAGTNRTVTFVATGGSSNKTWNLTLNFTGDVANYSLTDVPPGTTGLSAKTAWTLRQKLAVTLVLGQATADFIGASQLPGGDFDGNNQVNFLDYSTLAANYFTTDPVADITGDGIVNFTDYGILAANYFTAGDPE